MTSCYADPDIRTTPAGSYRHPRHFAVVTDGPPPPTTAARLVYRIRRQHGITQRQLAERLGGVTRRQVSRWERGIEPVPDHYLARLARGRKDKP